MSSGPPNKQLRIDIRIGICSAECVNVLLRTNSMSHTCFRLVPLLTLNDPEGS